MTFGVGSLDPTVPLELGLDSLALTQAVGALNRRFGIKLKFRELLDEEATTAALVDRIAPSAPPATALSAPEPLPAPSAPFVSSPAAVTQPVTGAERSATSWNVDASTLTHLLGRNAQDTPLVAGGRLGRDAQGNKAWFVPDPDPMGKFLQLKVQSGADA
jgi:Phosphopantetheine attachment site